ncbi:MAG: peptidoglycan D,D-transpeptidase FtsI family protein [Saccharospirillum sp.]
MARNWRFYLVQTILVALLAALVWRVVELQVLSKDFLIDQGTSRWQRVEVTNAPRGSLTDRHGEPIAVSTPVVSLWADPRELNPADIPRLAELSGVAARTLSARQQQHRAFMYVRRHMEPAEAEVILSQGLPGVYGITEYKRFYPAGEVAAHVVGFTDIDDRGQEGVELAFDNQLRSLPGRKEVIRDLLGRSVRDVGELEAPSPGQDLRLTLDMRLQYLAYRELKQAITSQGARAGSVVIMDVHNGDILAMVNQPGFNPNNRQEMSPGATRNRAMTDQFEPGSVLKPLAMASFIEQGLVEVDSTIDTSPGFMRLGDFSIRDIRNFGVMSMTDVIARSSNVGMARLALESDPQVTWDTYFKLGLGQDTGIGYPGEASGRLPNPVRWGRVESATMTYGYGLAVTPVQLAQAFASLANGGRRVSARLLMDSPVSQGEQVLQPETARQVLAMMEAAVMPGGTGTRAQLDWFSIAGKTGTVHKVGAQGYDEDRYVSSFVGIAPMDNPRIVAIIIIDEPPPNRYFGGEAAAPVFRGMMTQAMPLLGINPDRIPAQARVEERP